MRKRILLKRQRRDHYSGVGPLTSIVSDSNQLSLRL